MRKLNAGNQSLAGPDDQNVDNWIETYHDEVADFKGQPHLLMLDDMLVNVGLSSNEID